MGATKSCGHIFNSVVHNHVDNHVTRTVHSRMSLLTTDPTFSRNAGISCTGTTSSTTAILSHVGNIDNLSTANGG